jgi:hypothetical protein
MDKLQEITRELESFYQHYIDVFNREDDQFYECFALPYATISGERGLGVVASEADHRKAFARSMVMLKQRGWARSDIVSIKTWALADNHGMILSDVNRFKADNSELEKVRACYMLRRDGGVWKIVTISEVKPPYLGPGDVPRTS